MNESRGHSDGLKRRVVIIFFLGLLFMVGIVIAISWAFNDWGSIRLGWLNQVLGPALTVSGFALVIWSVRIQYILGKGTPAPMVATQKLVQTGPYACTRNPMTLGALFIYLGLGVWLGSGIVIALTLVVFSLLLAYIYIHETRELSERFGEAYLEYVKQTPFLFPHCWKSLTKPDLSRRQ